MLQMNMVLMYSTGKPIIKIGRVAGQFAKPRSSDYEEQNGIKLPSYRGDIINSIEFTKEARTPNPENMLQAYNHACSYHEPTKSILKGGTC